MTVGFERDGNSKTLPVHPRLCIYFISEANNNSAPEAGLLLLHTFFGMVNHVQFTLLMTTRVGDLYLICKTPEEVLFPKRNFIHHGEIVFRNGNNVMLGLV